MGAYRLGGTAVQKARWGPSAIEHIVGRSRETPDEWVISLQLPEAGSTAAVGPGALEAGG